MKTIPNVPKNLICPINLPDFSIKKVSTTEYQVEWFFNEDDHFSNRKQARESVEAWEQGMNDSLDMDIMDVLKKFVDINKYTFEFHSRHIESSGDGNHYFSTKLKLISMDGK